MLTKRSPHLRTDHIHCESQDNKHTQCQGRTPEDEAVDLLAQQYPQPTRQVKSLAALISEDTLVIGYLGLLILSHTQVSTPSFNFGERRNS